MTPNFTNCKATTLSDSRVTHSCHSFTIVFRVTFQYKSGNKSWVIHQFPIKLDKDEVQLNPYNLCRPFPGTYPVRGQKGRKGQEGVLG